MMTIATQCEDRREMVRKLSEFLSQPAIYLRAPTYAFRIGGITVNRDASVSGAPDHLRGYPKSCVNLREGVE